ncbi:MAG: GNAT family N-acetyltransferase [Legionellaceae bacterium]|nr:GNAT family N-acetyltransferase [Legionellaceae bacterium]
MAVTILPMHISDINAVAEIHAQSFSRQKNSVQWVSCNFGAFPRIMMFVARDEKDKVIGYIQWIYKSGFRNEAVIELEQIAVTKEQQGKGIGSKLIQESLSSVNAFLSDNNARLKAVLISTRTDNKAQALYKNVLGAETISIIKDLYSHDEVIMIAHVL